MATQVTFIGPKRRSDGTTRFLIGGMIFPKGVPVRDVPVEVVEALAEQDKYLFEVETQKPLPRRVRFRRTVVKEDEVKDESEASTEEEKEKKTEEVEG